MPTPVDHGNTFNDPALRAADKKVRETLSPNDNQSEFKRQLDAIDQERNRLKESKMINDKKEKDFAKDSLKILAAVITNQNPDKPPKPTEIARMAMEHVNQQQSQENMRLTKELIKQQIASRGLNWATNASGKTILTKADNVEFDGHTPMMLMVDIKEPTENVFLSMSNKSLNKKTLLASLTNQIPKNTDPKTGKEIYSAGRHEIWFLGLDSNRQKLPSGTYKINFTIDGKNEKALVTQLISSVEKIDGEPQIRGLRLVPGEDNPNYASNLTYATDSVDTVLNAEIYKLRLIRAVKDRSIQLNELPIESLTDTLEIKLEDLSKELNIPMPPKATPKAAPKPAEDYSYGPTDAPKTESSAEAGAAPNNAPQGNNGDQNSANAAP